VELDQVDVVDGHPLERRLQLGTCCITRAFAGLRGQEHLVAVLAEPPSQTVFRRAVRRCGVDVVDAPVGHVRERRVGAFLAHPTERSRPEDHAGRLVTGGSERRNGEHERDRIAPGPAASMAAPVVEPGDRLER
jgi:hypothetical protein